MRLLKRRVDLDWDVIKDFVICGYKQHEIAKILNLCRHTMRHACLRDNNLSWQKWAMSVKKKFEEDARSI